MIKEALQYINGLAIADWFQESAVPYRLVPEGFVLRSMEPFGSNPIRLRAAFRTDRITEFLCYAGDHFDVRSVVTVDTVKLEAAAVFDCFDGEQGERAGWGEHRAFLTLTETPEYAAFKGMCGNGALKQQSLIHFLEDYGDDLQFEVQGQPLTLAEALTALRKVEIRRQGQATNEVGDFSAQRTAMEQIEANTQVPLPDRFCFNGLMYFDTGVRTVKARLSLLTSEKDPEFRLRLVAEDDAKRAVAEEIDERLRDRLGNQRIYLGTLALKSA